MREFTAFTKKELIEQLRTYKVLIIVAVFFLFGMMSPLLAKLMPEIFKNMKLEGIAIILPVPAATDAYGQFFKNFTQMGLLVLLLVFGSTLSSELQKGTLVNILAKGLPRRTVILSKYLAAVLLWTIGYGLASAAAIGYTFYLFASTGVHHIMLSFFCLWLFGCFVIALILLSSTLTSGNFGGLILPAVVLLILLAINSLPGVKEFSPVTLASVNLALLNGTQELDGVIRVILITCGLIILSLYSSVLLFRKKKL